MPCRFMHFHVQELPVALPLAVHWMEGSFWRFLRSRPLSWGALRYVGRRCSEPIHPTDPQHRGRSGKSGPLLHAPPGACALQQDREGQERRRT